jgi:hypothetical protein
LACDDRNTHARRYDATTRVWELVMVGRITIGVCQSVAAYGTSNKSDVEEGNETKVEAVER